MSIIALTCVTLSLITRRHSWGARWETSASLGLSFVVAGFVLNSDTATYTLGNMLWKLTGVRQLDDFVGHLAWLAAVLSFIHHALSRLADDADLRAIFEALVRWPLTLCIPMMLGALLMSRASSSPVPVPWAVAHIDVWVMMYRALWYGCLLYLIALFGRIVWIVREYSPSWVIDAYLLSAALAAACIAALLLNVVLPLGATGVFLAYAVGSVAAIVAALTAAASWQIKLQSYRRLIKATRASPDGLAAADS
ncbi:membrane protein [Mycobacterium phage Guanica15]|uniref:Membrane protein n=1 Tax=Mycobacterium phage Yunkel11 TaxID=2599886 RepID=A0A5J6TBY4_9CAUD|nr:membrane protein [Mycobacterium phage Yunkel11]QFG08433.1 membrane protein [Mycobacterium phage Yunkel11]QFG11656.1 membrane protein [Mycobacterium phage Guanica15]